ncbi:MULTISPECIES: hypothetical protein [Rhodococcus]|uniref:hypothetical protein n=1 Tax=Rhodococcus TaxID=1827 RepID=UPI0002D4800C|nr:MULTISPECIES: hypothetical protein [Rhodococcus]QQZ18440.1 hypothetical protein GO592_40380 [Rhodococcus sp. 21391]
MQEIGTWLIRPEVPYAAVHNAAVGAGWAGGPVTLTPPLIRDEPELARFRRDDERATYEMNPVAMLRVWRARAAPPVGLPLIHAAEVLAMLDQTASTDPSEGLLRAVLAAGELRVVKAVPRLHVIRHRRLPPVVTDAVDASLSRITRQRRGSERRL